MSEDKYAVSPKWNAGKDFKKPFDVYIESSDQNLLVQRLDMPDLLKLGVAEEMDFMSKSLMNTNLDAPDAKGKVSEVVKMADNFEKMETMINAVCVKGILQPKVYPVPTKNVTDPATGAQIQVVNDAARQAGLFYVDYIPWDDRQELFGVIFETEGLSDFREEQEPGVGDVADVQTVQLPADGPVADVRSDQPEGVLL